LGLETDLQSDIVEMENDKVSYKGSGKIFHYITNLTPGTEPEKDSIRKYNNYIFNTTALIPNNGRYEGFKSSGKITSITNKELQNDILDLYQENISNLLLSTNYYNNRKQILQNLFYESVKWKPDGTSNLNAVLATDKARNISYSLSAVDEILSRYDSVINKSKKIIAAIEHEYK